MSKVFRVIAVVAAIVAIAASIAVTLGATAVIAGMTLSTIAAVASAVSAVAGALAQATMKPPDMKGSVSQVVIGKNLPVPYVMGRTYVGGMQVYDKSANGADNFDRTQIMVGTCAGPIDSFEKFLADYSQITFTATAGGLIKGKANGFYGADGGYMWLDSRKGLRPDTALAAPAGRAAFNAWGASYKLSGYAAWAVTMEFDEEGVRYSGGIPQYGMVAKWVKVYDPRLDSTYPGGSGSHRWDDEATWEWSENPGLHALTYLRGRFINGVKIVGVGLPRASINEVDFVALANVCDANGWTLGGAVYEGPGTSKWDNLKRILQAGGASPIWAAGSLSLRWAAPRSPTFAIGRDALGEGEIELAAMKPWRDRINTVVPRVRLETHKWEYEQLEAVSNATYVTEDGETKTIDLQFDLVQDEDQGAQLAALAITEGRELGPWRVPLKPAYMIYRPGEVGTLNLAEILDDPDLEEDREVIILGREIDPATGGVVLTLQTETTDKYAWALTQEGVPPPTPTIIPPEDIDQAVADTSTTPTDQSLLVANSQTRGLTFTIDTDGEVVVSAHERVYPDKVVAVAGGTITPSPALANPDFIGVFYDDPTRAGGAVTYDYLAFADGDPIDFMTPTADHKFRHGVVLSRVPTGGPSGGGSGAGESGGGGPGGGGGGGGINEN